MVFKLTGATGIECKPLILQMGKVRPRFRDPFTAGEEHSSDLPEDSLRAGAVSLLIVCFNVHCSFPGPSTR